MSFTNNLNIFFNKAERINIDMFRLQEVIKAAMIMMISQQGNH